MKWWVLTKSSFVRRVLINIQVADLKARVQQGEVREDALKARVIALEQVVVDQGILVRRLLGRLEEVELSTRVAGARRRSGETVEIINVADDNEDIVELIGGPIVRGPVEERVLMAENKDVVPVPYRGLLEEIRDDATFVEEFPERV